MTQNGKDAEAEFDPATWTPDKPWPKGYYKPVLGIEAKMERTDRATGNPGDGFRRWFWGLFATGSQLAGVFIVGKKLQAEGMVPNGAKTLTILGLLLFFELLLPALLFAGIVGGDRVPFRRSFAFGLLWSLGLLALFAFLAVARPVLRTLAGL